MLVVFVSSNVVGGIFLKPRRHRTPRRKTYITISCCRISVINLCLDGVVALSNKVVSEHSNVPLCTRILRFLPPTSTPIGLAQRFSPNLLRHEVNGGDGLHVECIVPWLSSFTDVTTGFFMEQSSYDQRSDYSSSSRMVLVAIHHFPYVPFWGLTFPSLRGAEPIVQKGSRNVIVTLQ